MHPTNTLPIEPSRLLVVDAKSGALRERKYRVTVVGGASDGRGVPIDGTVTVGTDPDAGLSVRDETVSRFHLELQARAEGVRVRDLKSTNGTFVSGARVDELWVVDETTLRVGKTVLRIVLEESDVETAQYENPVFGGAVGSTPVMRKLFGLLERVAVTDSTVMLLGETGTGKEMLARAVHEASLRKAGPLVVLDCGAVAPNLIESELFGHAKGSFTGAVGRRDGAFVRAEGGTLFLDEIAELPLEVQPKLLRALENRQVKPVGADRPVEVDLRVVAATHRDLEADVKSGRLREDLYYRLAVVVVRVPPLRERREDIPLLVRHFLAALGRPELELSAELMARLMDHPWPGNARELRNVVERALVGNQDPLAVGAPGGLASKVDLTQLPFKEAKEQLIESFSREYVQVLLDRCGGNISEVARTAGIARNWVHHLVTRYGLKTKT